MPITPGGRRVVKFRGPPGLEKYRYVNTRARINWAFCDDAAGGGRGNMPDPIRAAIQITKEHFVLSSELNSVVGAIFVFGGAIFAGAGAVFVGVSGSGAVFASGAGTAAISGGAQSLAGGTLLGLGIFGQWIRPQFVDFNQPCRDRTPGDRAAF